MNRKQRSPQIAIVYDHVTTAFGGAEVVLEQLHLLYPDAPLFTTVVGPNLPWLNGWPVTATFLQRLPTVLRRRHQWQALLAPLAVESFDLRSFDIVISVTAGAAKGVLTLPHQLHVCYLLTPTRYLYDQELFTTHRSLQLPIIRQLARASLAYLRWWDRAAGNRPDIYLTISQLVANRLERIHGQKAAGVVYPPFRSRITPMLQSTNQSTQQPLPQSSLPPFNLVISRLVWYKKVDVAIQAVLRSQKTLFIVGSGAAQKSLIKLAGDQAVVKRDNEAFEHFCTRAAQSNRLIWFCGSLTDDVTAVLLNHCQCLLMLGVEDFGMTALEALAAGKPVIVNTASGVAELLQNGKHGRLISKPDVGSVSRALTELSAQHQNPKLFSPALLKETALRYSDSVFRKTFSTTIDRMWQQWKATHVISP